MSEVQPGLRIPRQTFLPPHHAAVAKNSPELPPSALHLTKLFPPYTPTQLHTVTFGKRCYQSLSAHETPVCNGASLFVSNTDKGNCSAVFSEGDVSCFKDGKRTSWLNMARISMQLQLGKNLEEISVFAKFLEHIRKAHGRKKLKGSVSVLKCVPEQSKQSRLVTILWHEVIRSGG